MSFHNPDARQEKQTHEPHPDLALNIEKYNRQVSYIHWLVDGISIEICGKKDYQDVVEPDGRKTRSERIVEATHVLISWKDGRGVLQTMNISLHQKNHDFQLELCAVLNKLGQLGFLIHKKKENDGRYRQTPLGSESTRSNNWDRLFPKDAPGGY